MVARAYCIDSDVLIWHLRNASGRTTVTVDLSALADSGSLGCSAVTIAEVEQGVRPGEEESTRRLLRSLICYPADQDIAERAGEIVRALRPEGQTLGLADAIIAATCLVHGLALVTLNVGDFAKVRGLAMEALP